MAKEKADRNAAILEYALRHLERERDEIQAKIDHVIGQLGGHTGFAPVNAPEPAAAAPAARRKRVLSEAARKRIAAAQKRRWAEHRKTKAKGQ